MPNYRNKNRNRNKNKQHNKQQQQQTQKQENCKKESEEPPAPTNTIGLESPKKRHPTANCKVVTDASAVYSEHNDADVNASATNKSNELDVDENVPDVTTATIAAEPKTTTAVKKAETNDTVLIEQSQCDNKFVNKHAVNTSDNMGNGKSKIKDSQRESINQQIEEVGHNNTSQTTATTTTTVPINPPYNSALGKVIVHRIVCEDPNAVKLNKEETILNELAANVEKICESSDHECKKSINDMTQELLANERNMNQHQCKVLIHKIIIEDESKIQQQGTNQLTQQQQVKATVHKVVTPEDDWEIEEDCIPLENKAVINDNYSCQREVKVIVHKGVTSDDDTEIKDPNIQQANDTNDQQKVKVIVHKVETLSKDLEMQKNNKNDNLHLQQDVKTKEDKMVTTNNVTLEEEINHKSSNFSARKYSINDVATPAKNSNMEKHNIKSPINFEEDEHKVTTLDEDIEELNDITQPPKQHQAKVITHRVYLEDSNREPQITSPTMIAPLLPAAKPTTSEVRIVEISDESLSDLEELKSPVVSEAESSSIEYSDDMQNVSDSTIEVTSSCSTSTTTSTQKQSRKQKRIALEHHFLPQMLNPRFLDSISEENSELSDNSENPLSRSASTDNDATNLPLTEVKVEKLTSKYPQSSLDFSKTHKQRTNHNKKSKLIREETVAVAVAARLQDAPNADESCSTVRSCMSPEAEAAEIVFINSASSSMSDLLDMELFENGHTHAQELNSDSNLKDLTNKTATENICFESLTPSTSTNSPSTLTSAFIAKTQQRQQQQLPEFCAKQINNNNNNNNNQTINNSKIVNNDTTHSPHTPQTPSTTASTNKTRPLAETDTILNTNSKLNSILLSSSLSSPANDQLVFDQIEEQISSVLSSINEVALHNTTTKIPTTTKPSTTSSSSSPSLKIHTNLSNTQILPVTTTSKTISTRMLDTSCAKSVNASSISSLCTGNNAKTPRVFPQDVNMNTVRDIIINNNANNHTAKLNDLTNKATQHSHPPDHSSISGPDPKKLRLLCAETLASFPYGDAVLEELATVAQSIGEARAFKAVKFEKNMPYPLPELPHIDDLQLSLKVEKPVPDRPQPPQQDQSWLGVPTNNDPKVLVCLSPSQRSYIQQKPEPKPDDLLDAHQKFVERRGYHEYTKEQLQILEKEKLAEQQLLQTAAIMKKLRKSITPPPPQIPPPPVPIKSSETASKAQNLSKRTVTHTHTPNHEINSTHDQNQTSAASNGENKHGEENQNRLLSIMQDTSKSISNKQKHSVSSSSSAYENNSSQLTNGLSAPANEKVPSKTSALGNDTLNNSYQFIHKPNHKAAGNMQSVEATLGQMFPLMGSSNIFDQDHKRFSNIESSNAEPFCNQILNTQPKRYSSVETHCYESQKRIENGKVLEDFSTTKHETQTTGKKPHDFDTFPLTSSLDPVPNKSHLLSNKEHYNSAHHRNDQEIMSDLILSKHSSDIERKQQTATQSEITIKPTTETSENNANGENKSAQTDGKDQTQKQEPETENYIPKNTIQNTYEEFRQRAKAAADAVSTLPTLNTSATPAEQAKVTANGDNKCEFISSTMSSESTTTATTQHFEKTTIPTRDHEKLFKEFDDLSKQLHRELETSKCEREQREKSASMFDLNRIHMNQKHQIQEFNRRRHEHFKELEQQIDRSMKSRSLKFTRRQEPSKDAVDHQGGRTYDIPIQIENRSSTTATPSTAKTISMHEEAPPPPVPKHPKTYQIPIQIENSKSPNFNDSHFRRAESMFNIVDDVNPKDHEHSSSHQMPRRRVEDDWSKYASDFGSSENIARPFAKEVEICYQRRPGGIRAPRLTASTNDLSFNNQHSYDQFNAYNARRHHAPMLNAAPEQSRPKFGSCYSMIERDPNPKYISTTTRRGVSPAPQPSAFLNLDRTHVREEDMRQRRASLPRELHEQQLQYIASKEEELRTEFERLEFERRRLLDEAQNAQGVHMVQTPTSPITPTRLIRDHYRTTQKLPTLTEDEVFRQQMAEEWLNKVAEREKRRLQNIIKISKIHEDGVTSKHKADMEQEFLSRVKERRHKLAMPADSDWDSGAESHPTTQAQLSETDDVPPIKIIEGEKEANLRRLPRHLREFAKFSNHQKENIEGGHREEHQEEERSEETTDNSVSRAFKKSSVVKTVKTLRAPMLTENHGNENANDDDKTVNDNVKYDNFTNSNYDGDNDFDVSTSNRHPFHPFSNFFSTSPSSSELLTQFPGSFDEMFGKSPFSGHIFEEFKNYWRKFHDTGNKF